MKYIEQKSSQLNQPRIRLENKEIKFDQTEEKKDN